MSGRRLVARVRAVDAPAARPPVTGVADPTHELDRIARELEAHAEVR